MSHVVMTDWTNLIPITGDRLNIHFITLKFHDKILNGKHLDDQVYIARHFWGSVSIHRMPSELEIICSTVHSYLINCF